MTLRLSRPSVGALALIGVGICALIWGTTWYAITLQLGSVDPVASIVWRFGLASALLFAISKVCRLPLRLTRHQQLAALGQGIFAFSISYSLTYAAEARIASAVVAVIFAALALINLMLFQFAAGQKATPQAWGGALLGLAGVAVLSGGQALAEGGLGGQAWAGVALAAGAVIASAFGNLYAWKGQEAGAAVLPQTAWAMAHGTGLLVLFGLATGVEWSIEPTAAYLGSLFYLSVFGSVVAFGLYFTVARVRGYVLASYISALTPPIAMLVSVVFEDATFGVSALVGLGLVLAGQLLLVRAPRRP